ncbi:hypothetical protein [Methylobacterium sp.]|uniref:hypothetical protein n=1 Tax=Methylobacterium sp. TaxID=409 RepID=UPI00257AFF51|nr:hypothetical protein [Methylobacterium sp.]
MGQAKQKRQFQQATGFVTRAAKVCEYELCFPGPLGEQSKEWIGAALPSDDDIEIARKALGAPVTRFASTWVGAPLDVYVVEDWNNIPAAARVVNADATLALHVALQKRGVPLSRIVQQPPVIGPNVSRYTENWTQVNIRHKRATDLAGEWRSQGEGRFCLIKQKTRENIDIYLKYDEDLVKLRGMFNELLVMARAA